MRFFQVVIDSDPELEPRARTVKLEEAREPSVARGINRLRIARFGGSESTTAFAVGKRRRGNGSYALIHLLLVSLVLVALPLLT